MACDNFLWFPIAAQGGMATGAGNTAAQPVGETQDDWMSKLKPVAALEIKSFNFGVTQAHTTGSAAGGASAGKAAFNEFTVSKYVDLASVPIFTACTVGAHFPWVMLAIRKAGGIHLLYLQYVFGQVFVTGIDWSGGGGDEPMTENIKFRFGAMGIQYQRQSATGLVGGPQQSMWSVVTNSPTLSVPDLPTAPKFIDSSQS
jgi:type VI secretion system secreted protein Hcp